MHKSEPFFKAGGALYSIGCVICNDVRRKPSKPDINVRMLLAKITCTVYLLMHVCAGHAKKGNALTFCNKKLGDMRSEERRRVIKLMFTFEFYEFVTISCM